MMESIKNIDWTRFRQVFFRYFVKTLIYSFVVLSVILVGAIGVGLGVVSAFVKDEKIRTKEDFQKDLNGLFLTSYAYFQNKDKNGNYKMIGSFRYENNDRNVVRSLDEVSPYLIDAFISIEDKEFFNHNGIVPRSLLRAAYQQLTGQEVVTGGSTITQQLVKNIILKDPSKELERKAREIVLALRLERLYSKEEILLNYMNSMFFGKGAHGRNMTGVKSAARGLFNKDVKDLNLAQAAFIAGMVQRPSEMSPFSDDPENFKRGLERMKLVLEKMLENGKITEEQYQEALKFDLKASLAKPSDFGNGYQKYPFIMFALEDEAAETLMEIDHLNIEELSKQGKYRQTLQEYKKRVATGGYHFYTTIDENLYNAINQAATKGLKFHKRTYKGKPGQEQLGAVIIENKTGAVLAFVSGTEKFSENQKDHAFDTFRQPGSTIKPLLVYGPAMEEGLISPTSKIIDEKIPKMDGSGYYVNANGKYRGPVTVQEALKWSYNIPAVKTFRALGFEKGFEYLRKMGLKPHENDGEASAVGGFYKGFTVEQMTAAFATIANEGKYNKPFMIYKVTDSEGKVIWERKQNPKQVFSPQTAYKLTQILKTVLSGTARTVGNALPSGYEVAGKTGTTSEDKDIWFIGYTPEVTIGVWAGYDWNFRMNHNHYFAQRAWINIFKAAIHASPQYFPKGSDFINPGNLGPEICGFECSEVEEYNQKKEQEEQKKKEEEEKKNKGDEEKKNNEKPDPPKEEKPGDNPQIVPPPGNPPSGNDQTGWIPHRKKRLGG